MRVCAIVAAAGRAERFGDSEPKQFWSVSGKPVLGWVVEKLAAHPAVATIAVMVPPGYEARVGAVLSDLGRGKVEMVLPGGPTRQDSVRLALEHLQGKAPFTLIHDGARPCFSLGLVDRVLKALRSQRAVVPVVPCVETLLHVSAGSVDAVLDREGIAGAQTPQGFSSELIYTAHREAWQKGFTSSDDGSLVLFLGEEVSTVPGEPANLKITYRDDIALAEFLLNASPQASDRG